MSPADYSSRPGSPDPSGDCSGGKRAPEGPRREALPAQVGRALFREHPDGVFWLEPIGCGEQVQDFRLVAINPAGTRLLRMSEQEATGQPLSRLLRGGPEARWMASVRSVWEQGGPLEFRVPTMEPSGLLPKRWFGLQVQRVGDAVLVLVREETALCRAERELARTEARLRQTERIAHVGSFAYDLSRGRAWWSEEVYRIAGLEPGALKAGFESGLTLVHPDDRERLVRAVAAAKRQGGAFSNEYRLVRPDGSVRRIRSNGQVLQDDQGQPAEMVGIMQDVTELEEGQQRLRASEARFRRVADNLPIILFELDAAGTVLFTQGKGLARQGFEAWDVVGRSVFEIYADRPDFLANVRRALAGEALVVTNETRGGVYERWLEPLRSAGGQVVGVVGVSLDVTERFRAEAELRASQALLRTVVDGLPHLVWAKDREGRYLMANRAMGDLHGLMPEQLVGRRMQDLPHVPAAVATAHESLDREVLEDLRAVDDADFHLAFPDGGTRRLRVQKRPLMNPGQELLGLVGIAEDITEKNRIEQELEQSRTLLQAIFDTFPARIMVAGQDGQTLLVNRAHADELGTTPREAVLRGDGCPPLSEAEQRRKVTELHAVLRAGRSFDSERQRTRADGTEVHERVIRVPLYDGAGTIYGALNIALDITAQKATEAQLRQAQKLEAVGQLAGGIAHDFNNLLQIIIGHGAIAERHAGGNEALAHAIQQIQGAVNRAGELTRKLLAFSRRQVLRPRRVDLHALMDELLRMLSRVLGSHIDLRQELHPDGPCIQADPGMVEQVLMNLCVNARDAMPDGGVLTLRTECVTVDEAQRAAYGLPRAGRYVRIVTADTGGGMPDEVLGHIFEPFYTTKPPDQGTGLGLSTVYGIVRQHGGAIHVESTLGEGTTFSVLLPECEQDAPMEASEGPSSIPRGSETVLVVEQESTAHGLLADLLQSQGYRALTAQSVEEAHRLFQAHRERVSLVLLDVRMPRDPTRAFVARLREDGGAPPLLLSTGYLASPGEIAFIRAHGIDLIEKPYSPYELFRKVRELLDREEGPARD